MASAAVEKPRGRVILKMSVQLPPSDEYPDGQKGTIHVFPGSDPKELAEAFCYKHQLTDPKVGAEESARRAVVRTHPKRPSLARHI